MQRITGRDVELRLPTGVIALCDQITLNLSVGTKAVRSGGYPAGWVYGEVTGDGEMTIDSEEVIKLLDAAEEAGSWEEMDAFDIVLAASVSSLDLRVEAFGCKLDVPDFKIDRKGGDKITHTLKFEITDPQFVRVNGVPLARTLQTTG